MNSRHASAPAFRATLPERRAAARAWLRLSPPVRAMVPRPRVYKSDARDQRSYKNIALSMGATL